MPGIPAERIFTVNEITLLIKSRLEEDFPWVTVQGEVSNFRPSSTGHWYFSLKDADAVLSLVMFRNRIDAVRFSPADGMVVKATGSISVYPRRGNYQLICETLRKAGEGDILAALEERKRSLAAEGLFDADRKKPLPLCPDRVVVITSPTGAAVRDILRVLRRRNAGIDVVIIPVPVQGVGADERIARAVAIANRHALGDVIIVGRGGGSLEDLLPFSSEEVVRAIASSAIPVISAVGHETDVTLSDLAADVRAPTPSAAAEMVAASREELLGRVRGARGMLQRTLDQRLERVHLLLAPFRPETLLRNVKVFVQPLVQRADDAREDLLQNLTSLILAQRHRCELATRELASSSPLSILGRGYAVVTDERSGKVLVSAEAAHRGDGLSIRLARGGLRAVVEETHADQE